ncbi:MAG: glycoside hydrolase family 9 protein [Lachnospiraceae bacterium]|nr:glycoside hydrolase family 9 protein [Lachnospiraceae bacterium]
MILDAKKGYFENGGVNVMVFDDIYPAGHQSGISIIMHDKRIAANGDLRFEQTPGQWQPVPAKTGREVDEATDTVRVSLEFPDDKGNLKGLNPMIYPDLTLRYDVIVKGDGSSVTVTVDLKDEIPEIFDGKACFNIELFPGELFGKPWIMDNKQGVFPRQANGPVKIQPSNFIHSGHNAKQPEEGQFNAVRELLAGIPEPGTEGYSGDNMPVSYNPIIADDMIALEYAEGRVFTLCPDDPYKKLRIECQSDDTSLKLYDGRLNHNNGWFVISSEIPAGRTGQVLKWRITPDSVPEWRHKPVVQVSNVGFHPGQAKYAVIELDRRAGEEPALTCALYRIAEEREELVRTLTPDRWGEFLRYFYLVADFSDIEKEGLYRVTYGDSSSELFRIAEDIYDRGVWQPVLEYFLPVQMCHMRVNEKYRVWHGLCHADDARMAKTAFNHFDAYRQGASTLTGYKPGDAVPGLNKGGWHDAGDFDLRIESQAGESYILSLAFEEFGVDIDTTTIDQDRRIVEIHQPDGKNDILQQIEHGLLSVLGGYHALGRLYRGIICSSLRQYVLLGDPVNMTDGVVSDDDRWVFTEENPFREFITAGQLAACARSMKGYNDPLSADCIKAAEEIYAECAGHEPAAGDIKWIQMAHFHAAAELFISTRKSIYRDYLLSRAGYAAAHMYEVGWLVARVIDLLDDADFEKEISAALPEFAAGINKECDENPYGIPYHPYIWGAGWGIQEKAKQYYFLQKKFPGYFGREPLEKALNFILGCHPGINTASFASGVGTRSATTAYGMNRADWSYIPGGVISGTALIRPDFPELLEYPFLWQQTEYVLGGGSSNYMFLVLAVQNSIA